MSGEATVPAAESLDDPATYALDRSGMFEHIRRVGPELVRAWDAAARLEPPPGAEKATSLVIAGIGGSATAGDYFCAIAAQTCPIPVSVLQGSELPAWVGPSTLVVVCSYSGNTGETLVAFEAAAECGAMIVAVTSGGELATRAAARSLPVCPIAYEASPRATTVHTLAPLLRLGLRLGLTAVRDPEIAAAAGAHERLVVHELAPEVPLAANGAKRLAAAVHGRFPIVLGSGHLAPAAVRFKNQLAENGKSLGAADFMPEAGHNLVVGLETARHSPERFAVIALETANRPPGAAAILQEFEGSGLPVHRVTVDGGSRLADLLLATAWGDYVSCYLALLNGQDPTPVPQIDRVRAYVS